MSDIDALERLAALFKPSKKTHCAQGHPFTAKNTRFRTDAGHTGRECLVCSREYRRKYMAKYSAKKKEAKERAILTRLKAKYEAGE